MRGNILNNHAKNERGFTMKKHSLRRCAAAIAAFTVMAGAMPVIPFSASAAENIVTNSTFDNGTADWGIYKESGEIGRASCRERV